MDTEENWLTKAARKAEDHLLSMPYESLGPAGRRLVDAIVAETIRKCLDGT